MSHFSSPPPARNAACDHLGGAAWAALAEELDRWAEVKRPASFWWRDDDAVAATPALDSLLALSERHRAPLALAVIPAAAGTGLAEALAGSAAPVTVFQHGFAHRNHAPSGEKAAELGDHRDVATVAAELADGRDRLAALFADRFLPAMVPPWNRIGAEVEAALDSAERIPEGISIVDAPETIGMEERPLQAVRGKRKSSVVVGLELHKQGDADAFVSAGNTGAIMAASRLLLGLHDGIERPAIGAVLPTGGKPVLVLDAGANIDCSPKELLGFAHLGAVYARDVLGRSDPTVGLLNIGEEDAKGNADLSRNRRCCLTGILQTVDQGVEYERRRENQNRIS